MSIQHPVLKQISAILDQVEAPILKLFEDGKDAEAIQGAQRLKGYAVRYKVAPDNVVDQAVERLRAAATEAARSQGDQPIADWLDRVAAQLAPKVPGRSVVTDSGRQSVVPTTKAAQPDRLQAIIQGDLTGWDGR